jgi:hypothetical protein
MEAELFEQLEAMDDAAPAAAAVSMMVGQALPPKSSEVVSDFGSQPISRTFLPCWAIM